MAHIQTVAQLWALVADAWNRSFMGITIGQIVTVAFILVIAALIRRLFSATVLRHIHVRFGRADITVSDAVTQALGPPLRFVPIVVAIFLISQIVTANREVEAVFAEVNRSLVTLTIFWALAGLLAPLFSALDGKSDVFNHAMVGWTVRIGKVLVALVGGATILEIWGIRVGPILTGLGLFGAAVALGAQDLFRNLIAGIFIIAERRFQNGDWILAENVVEGTVETIGLRTTKIRRFDLAPVYVPNSKLADNAVTNYAQMTHRRISWIVGLEYDTTVDQLRRIRGDIEAYILGCADFVHPPEGPTFVRVDKFNESSIDLMIYCFSRTTVWEEWLKIKEALAYAIKGIVEGSGSGFAFPSRSLYVEALPTGADLFSLHPQEPAEHRPAADLARTARGNGS